MVDNNNNNPIRGEDGSNATFFLDTSGDDGNAGQFDWNANQYKAKQIKFARDLEAQSNCEFWIRKEKFAEYDYDLTLKGSNDTVAAALVIPGIPLMGYAELKCRNYRFNQFPDTVVDTEKMNKLISRATFSKIPVFICWRFVDGDYYYEVQYSDLPFKVSQIRNTHVTHDNPHEYKQVSHIPIKLLKKCHKGMFN